MPKRSLHRHAVFWHDGKLASAYSLHFSFRGYIRIAHGYLKTCVRSLQPTRAGDVDTIQVPPSSDHIRFLGLVRHSQDALYWMGAQSLTNKLPLVCGYLGNHKLTSSFSDVYSDYLRLAASKHPTLPGIPLLSSLSLESLNLAEDSICSEHSMSSMQHSSLS